MTLYSDLGVLRSVYSYDIIRSMEGYVMNVQKWLAGLAAFVLFLSCSVYAQPAKVTGSSPKSNLLVSGEIVPIKNGRTSPREKLFSLRMLTQ